MLSLCTHRVLRYFGQVIELVRGRPYLLPAPGGVPLQVDDLRRQTLDPPLDGVFRTFNCLANVCPVPATFPMCVGASFVPGAGGGVAAASGGQAPGDYLSTNDVGQLKSRPRNCKPNNVCSRLSVGNTYNA